MQTQIVRLITVPVLAVTAAAMLTGCASTESAKAPKEQDVRLAQVSEPARVTINREVGGGHVDKITKEIEHGKTVYDVEATVGGRHMEYLIADSNGELLGTEVPIEFSQMPQAVQDATEKYFGTKGGLTVMKGVEYGETHYEIEGPKNGKKVEVTFDSTGKKGK